MTRYNDNTAQYDDISIYVHEFKACVIFSLILNSVASQTSHTLPVKVLTRISSMHSSSGPWLCLVASYSAACSHFHLDHCGALPFFTEMMGYDGPIYMTQPTKVPPPRGPNTVLIPSPGNLSDSAGRLSQDHSGTKRRNKLFHIAGLWSAFCDN